MLKITQITDPVCTWCYGNEPELRTIEFLYGAKCDFLMGGLVEDIRNFYDAYNDIGGDASRSNNSIISHWREASTRHKMPITSGKFELFSNEFPSTYPQNIAYKAALLSEPHLASLFLRNIRVATACYGKITSKPEVLIEIANESGLDIAQFLKAFESKEAKEAFLNDRRAIASLGVRGFPAFLIEYNGKRTLLRGYQSLESFKAVIKALGAESKEVVLNKEEVMRYLNTFKSAFLCELEVCFGKEYLGVLKELQAEGKVELVEVENTFEARITNQKNCTGNSCNI